MIEEASAEESANGSSSRPRTNGISSRSRAASTVTPWCTVARRSAVLHARADSSKYGRSGIPIE